MQTNSRKKGKVFVCITCKWPIFRLVNGQATEQSQFATEIDTSSTNIVIRVAKQRACQNLESVKVTQKNEIDAKLFVFGLKQLSKFIKQFKMDKGWYHTTKLIQCNCQKNIYMNSPAPPPQKLNIRRDFPGLLGFIFFVCFTVGNYKHFCIILICFLCMSR